SHIQLLHSIPTRRSSDLIALPSFLGQKNKGYDASAKSNARNMVSQLESCYVDAQNYGQCAAEVTSSGLPQGTGTGQVEYSSSGADGCVLVGHSETGCNFL